MPTIKPTRVFTREEPCTKVHLWNAFIGPTGLASVSVVESRSQIGLNAPKYLLKQEYLTVVETKGVEYYKWTKEGAKWLREGLKRHLELNPGDKRAVLDIKQLLPTTPAPRRIVRRVK